MARIMARDPFRYLPLTITPELMRLGESTTYGCPIALALERATGLRASVAALCVLLVEDDADGDSAIMYIGGLSMAALAFMRAYDGGTVERGREHAVGVWMRRSGWGGPSRNIFPPIDSGAQRDYSAGG